MGLRTSDLSWIHEQCRRQESSMTSREWGHTPGKWPVLGFWLTLVDEAQSLIVFDSENQRKLTLGFEDEYLPHLYKPQFMPSWQSEANDSNLLCLGRLHFCPYGYAGLSARMLVVMSMPSGDTEGSFPFSPSSPLYSCGHISPGHFYYLFPSPPCSPFWFCQVSFSLNWRHLVLLLFTYHGSFHSLLRALLSPGKLLLLKCCSIS